MGLTHPAHLINIHRGRFFVLQHCKTSETTVTDPEKQRMLSHLCNMPAKTKRGKCPVSDDTRHGRPFGPVGKKRADHKVSCVAVSLFHCS